jgi:chemotaxis protein histidine kinase CheA/CheY-like chemotaxis protein
MTDPDDELAELFRDEAMRRLDAMDAALLEIETGNAGAETVTGLFREAHTIKGAASMVGQDDVRVVAHAVEDILSVLRDRDTFPASLVPGLLRATGLLRGQVAGHSGPAGLVLDELAATRAALAHGGGPTAAAPPAAGPEPSPVPGGPVPDGRGPGALPAASPVPGAPPAASTPPGALPAASTPPEAPRPAGGPRPAGAPRPGGASGPGPAIRVPAGKIDRMLDLVGEVVLNHGRLAHSVGATTGLPDDVGRRLSTERQLLGELTDSAVRMRTLPVSAITGPLPRAIRDIAQAVGKQVEFTVAGGDTELDRAILESLAEPLTHLLRNAVSHGIEPPDERRRAGKPAFGRLELRAVPLGSLVEISVTDDGRGISTATAEEAEREGSLTEVLARPGYSTAAEVTDLAGRGVGMDAVQVYARSVGGTLEVHSQPGHGLTATLVLPLALAQLEVLLLRRGPDVYGIPIAAVDEVLLVTETRSVQGQLTVPVRDHPVPLADIAVVLGLTAPALPDHPAAVVVSAGGRRVAIQCDRLIGAEEVVVKPLGPLAQADGCLGATILGDGRVALLIEPGLFTRRDRMRAGPAPAAQAAAARATSAPATSAPAAAHHPDKILVVEDSFTVRELQRSIFEAAGYRVATAEDGRDALAVLQRDPDIALVVSDLDMPGLDGLGLTRAVRADPVRSTLPVIIVTARGTERVRQQGIAAGVNAFMAKAQFDQRELLATVGRLVRG